jgi:hypothetical protein
MTDKRDTIYSRIVSEGWTANIVVTVIFAALTQGSILGTIFGIGAMVVLLITSSRFRANIESAPRTAGLYKAATRIGVAFAALCVATSLYASFRPILLSELPKQTLDMVAADASAHQPGGATAIQLTQYQGGATSIFGYREKDYYQVISARALADHIFGDGVSKIDYAAKVVVVILGLWFIGALIIGWFAQEIWRTDIKDPGE